MSQELLPATPVVLVLLQPSDAYLSWVLETAADAPIASPLRGVILSPLEDPGAEEEQEESPQQADDKVSKRGEDSHMAIGLPNRAVHDLPQSPPWCLFFVDPTGG